MAFKKPTLIGLAATALALTAAVAQATDYPTKPITLVVPFSAGGGADNAARLIARTMEKVAGQPIVIENKSGASGTIGAGQVARSAPDGYTVLYDASSFAINSVLRELPYDAKNDFIPVSQAVVVPNILVVSAKSPYKTLADFVTAAKAKPGMITYASYGPGSLAQMAGELLQKEAKLEMVHIPYKGGAPAMVDVLGGHVDSYFANAASSLNYVRSGELRALAVTSNDRMDELPNVPTVAESGIKGFSVYEWNALFVPKGTPADVVNKLQEILATTLKDPELQAKLKNLGLTAVGSTPSDFARFLEAEQNRWSEVAEANNISLD